MMKSRRNQRSKSLPDNQSRRKSFFSSISRRLSLSSRRRSDSVRLYDDSEDEDTLQVIPQEVPLPTTQSRFSRRASRFWSTSSANQFEDDSFPQSPTYPTYGGAPYVPRHAASDFSKTATNRLTMMAEADETTLCSFNYRTHRASRSFSTDDGLDVDHREQALNALTARRSIALSSESSNESANDYALFYPDAATGADARRRRSAAAWTELEYRAALANRRTGDTDLLIGRQGRQSAYMGLPGSTYEYSRPASSVAVNITEYIRPAHAGRAW